MAACGLRWSNDQEFDSMSVKGHALSSLHDLGGVQMWGFRVQGEHAGVGVEDLPAADDGDSHQGHDKHNPGCRRASNQGQLLPQLRFVIV